MPKKDIAPILKESIKIFSIEVLQKMRDYLLHKSDDEGIRQILEDIDTEILKRQMV